MVPVQSTFTTLKKMKMKKTWFITGASRGFGRIWTEAALKRGDQVAATARDVAGMADLTERFGDAMLPLALDVTNAEQVRQAVVQAHAHFGRLDVVLNNAGYSLVGTTEEASVEEVQAMFDTNYLRDATGHPGRLAFAAATGQRPPHRCLQQPWRGGHAAHRLLLRLQVGF